MAEYWKDLQKEFDDAGDDALMAAEQASRLARELERREAVLSSRTAQEAELSKLGKDLDELLKTANELQQAIARVEEVSRRIELALHPTAAPATVTSTWGGNGTIETPTIAAWKKGLMRG